jgi:hypothetical protein
MNTSFFSKLGWQGQPNFEKTEISGGGGFTQGGGRCGLALGWYDVALSGRRAQPTKGDLSIRSRTPSEFLRVP